MTDTPVKERGEPTVYDRAWNEGYAAGRAHIDALTAAVREAPVPDTDHTINFRLGFEQCRAAVLAILGEPHDA